MLQGEPGLEFDTVQVGAAFFSQGFAIRKQGLGIAGNHIANFSGMRVADDFLNHP